MAKAVIVGNSPYITDYYRKNAKALFDETGGNSGNLAFNYAVANHIQAPQFAHWALPPADLRAKGDVVVLPLANQLGKHTDLGQAASRLSDIDLPIIGIGLGAQTGLNDADIELSDGTRLWLETIVKRAPSSEPNIGVRGAYTQKQIARLGYGSAVTVTGCPSNFINLHDDIGELVENGFKKKPRRIAVAAGIPYIPVLAGIERQLADIVTITGGSYIVQHGLQMLQLARNEFDQIGETTLEDYRRYIMPLRTVDEFKSWCRQYACAFYDVRAWMDHLRGFDFVIGTRFHGAHARNPGRRARCLHRPRQQNRGNV